MQSVSSGWSVTPIDVIDAESFERVRERVSALPDVTRRVVTLRKVYGLSQEEIARRLDLSADEVLDHLFAAITACADFGDIADG